MALSDDEQDRLDELAGFTESADPGFAERLGWVAAERWKQRQSAFAWFASLLGVFATLAGLSAARGLISIGTIIACYGFVLIVWGSGATLKIIQRKLALARATRECT
ncbi:MAG: DUF3040 domain-containing protein [Nakamurella sp.]